MYIFRIIETNPPHGSFDYPAEDINSVLSQYGLSLEGTTITESIPDRVWSVTLGPVTWLVVKLREA